MAQVDDVKERLRSKRAKKRLSLVKPSEEEVKAAEEELSRQEAEDAEPKEEVEEVAPPTPQESFLAFIDKVEEFLRTDMADFRLKLKKVADYEFVVYQGSFGNVWGRFDIEVMRFHRTVLERRMERVGLIQKSNDLVTRPT